ncbi:hypothetical protein JR316_0003250 [Psilocybe cubensis]|uniref:HTH APSES-type domain-containing protein n=2 Tax=Psilocybe cubensis TaxID=181762 RepID=A0A8H7Y4L0_PSICU|nr:hypothetical protein JR316_0003250 [Psilocybe cubensis]KAH9483774.1 hypothetical protein JR316_0003250 [Psilocybe cubensis]
MDSIPRRAKSSANNVSVSPVPSAQLPPFPPPGIVLHPDDATNKVFIAIARAFLSVDNRAMTIKDIAERATAYGLQCQNLSAGSQAVTTYIRAHRARCDREDDAPLLLSHTLSGTPADDDLVPALFSRAGGDSHPLPERLTNFRKGTAVWYLGRATGVPCPFERAGIRLCDYAVAGGSSSAAAVDRDREGEGERGEQGRRLRKSLRTREKQQQREMDAQERCGEKRKRQVKHCITARVDGGSDNERPPKVKLLLRLKPLLARTPPTESASPPKEEPSTPAAALEPEGSSSARPIDVSKEEDEDSYDSDSSEEEDDDDEEDSMSVDQPPLEENATAKDDEQKSWPLPAYAHRSVSIPRYTPNPETFQPSYRNLDHHRSPSVPFGCDATPPPDSEDEADEYHVTMSRYEDYSEDEKEEEEEEESVGGDGWDADEDEDEDLDLDLDSDDEGEASETVFESPGPRSPSAPLLLPPVDAVKVKEEPRDVQGMLDLWEDFDSSVADARVVDVLAKALELDLFDAQRGVPGVAAAQGSERERREKLKVKTEELSEGGGGGGGWVWDTEEATARMIKQESDDNFDALFPLSTPGPLSPLSSMTAQFAAFSTGYGYEDGVSSAASESPRPFAEEEETVKWDQHRYDTVRPRAKTVPPPMPFFTQHAESSSSSSVPPLPRSMDRRPSAPHESTVHPTPSSNLARFYHSITANATAAKVGSASGSMSLPPPTPCVSPLQTRCQQPVVPPLSVVVTTCQPCKPAISATQIEDISVYHMMLGAFQLLRRIDTDFVNLSPIAALAASSTPPLKTLTMIASAIPNAVVIPRGSPQVCGTWVPLAAAQEYVRVHLPEERKADLAVFLDDELVERFPEALRDFYRSGRKGRGLGVFGKHFASTLQAAELEVQMEGGASAVQQRQLQSPQRQQQITVQTSASASVAAQGMFVGGVTVGKHLLEEDVVPPLSASEQQLFHELCVMPDDERVEEEAKEEQDGMDVDMHVDGDVDGSAPPSASSTATFTNSTTLPASASAPASMSAPAPAPAATTPQRPTPLDLSVKVDVALDDEDEPMSPLSPLPPSPVVCATVTASGVVLSTPMSPLCLAQKGEETMLSVPECRLDNAPLLGSSSQMPVTTPAAVASTPATTDNGRPLRRSKRVADANATLKHPPPPLPVVVSSKARARKNGSRNSLS